MALNVRADVPNVVVTLKPIHSLVAGVMSGLKVPTLLLSGESSPHTQLLTPMEVRQITAAEVIVWVGPSYEAPLQGMIGSKKNSQVITLIDKPGMILHQIRQGGMWGNHSHTDHCVDADNCPEHGDTPTIDGHLWLDPENAKAIVVAIAEELGNLDPEHREIYAINSENVISRLNDLDRELKQLLLPIMNKPYLVYHDGTQYFDYHFKTKAVGVLIGDGHYGVNAQHLLNISEFIRAQKVRCVFTEPQFPADNIHSLLDKTGTRVEILDYLGIGLEADEDAYFLMMRNLANAFIKGLGGS
jgi:zinc transport system substrate-binding protein